MTSMHARELTICYGMTEAGTLCQTLPEDSPDDRTSTVGAVHPHVECKVVDPATERTVPRGEPGELWARGYCTMSGYWSDDAATRRAMTPTGWIRTGDLAVMEAGGHVRIIDRLKDLIISGGQNVYPADIESLLEKHSAVREVAVIGIDHAQWGETPLALVVAEADAIDAGTLRDWTNEQLGKHQRIAGLVFVDALPRNPNGKVLKRELRAAWRDWLCSDLEDVDP
jgi:acyl-CoA synthetase (AMP-forming)/AMP-acid ligase II